MQRHVWMCGKTVFGGGDTAPLPPVSAQRQAWSRVTHGACARQVDGHQLTNMGDRMAENVQTIDPCTGHLVEGQRDGTVPLAQKSAGWPFAASAKATTSPLRIAWIARCSAGSDCRRNVSAITPGRTKGQQPQQGRSPLALRDAGGTVCVASAVHERHAAVRRVGFTQSGVLRQDGRQRGGVPGLDRLGRQVERWLTVDCCVVELRRNWRRVSVTGLDRVYRHTATGELEFYREHAQKPVCGSALVLARRGSVQ